MKQIRLPRWGKAILIIALVILLAAALAKPAEKLFLSIILPGQWELWAGGGAHRYDFRSDGTVTVRGYESTRKSTWRLKWASASERESIWTHPQIMLTIGERSYGIFLEFEGFHVNGGERISDVPWSFALSDDMGGGMYIRSRQK